MFGSLTSMPLGWCLGRRSSHGAAETKTWQFGTEQTRRGGLQLAVELLLVVEAYIVHGVNDSPWISLSLIKA